ncbi:MAG: sigma-54-dependent transcriptional regulator [Anaerovoracaceae bacterium]|jgi:two-component system response regulator HydG
MTKKLKILVVDDESAYCDVLSAILGGKGYAVQSCGNGREALQLLDESSFDLVITDLLMPEMDGMELLQEIKNRGLRCEVIMLTAFGTIERAVKAMKMGAYGYVTKGNDPEELLLEVSKVAEIKAIQDENATLRKKVGRQTAMLESRNEKFRKMMTLAQRAAQSESNILILGESGSGKEVLANYIHSQSARSEQSFMELNCQALSESILESELFGHEKGAFTGADQQHIGLFEAADHGTLFLDEIGGVSMNLQGKLLKAIESKTIYRVGSTKPISTDFRLITATNHDLEADMAGETFRSDLFYRLSTIILELPPLRARREDIPLFIDYFLQCYQKEMKKKITDIDDEVRDFLLQYDYPGNIRELRNIIERMVVLSEHGEITADYLPSNALHRRGSRTLGEELTGGRDLTLKEYRSEAERVYIRELLDKFDDDLDQVAATLSITRRQLLNKLNEYGLRQEA